MRACASKWEWGACVRAQNQASAVARGFLPTCRSWPRRASPRPTRRPLRTRRPRGRSMETPDVELARLRREVVRRSLVGFRRLARAALGTGRGAARRTCVRGPRGPTPGMDRRSKRAWVVSEGREEPELGERPDVVRILGARRRIGDPDARSPSANGTPCDSSCAPPPKTSHVSRSPCRTTESPSRSARPPRRPTPPLSSPRPTPRRPPRLPPPPRRVQPRRRRHPTHNCPVQRRRARARPQLLTRAPCRPPTSRSLPRRRRR